MIKDHVKMMALWWPRVEIINMWLPPEWVESGHRLWWSPQLKSSPQLELWALMVQECQTEVVARVLDAAESDEG